MIHTTQLSAQHRHRITLCIVSPPVLRWPSAPRRSLVFSVPVSGALRSHNSSHPGEHPSWRFWQRPGRLSALRLRRIRKSIYAYRTASSVEVAWRKVPGYRPWEGIAVAEPPAVPFGRLLRRLRIDAGLTQEELAERARLSYRSISDLERGISLAPRKETIRLLADALNLVGAGRAEFEATARWPGRVTLFMPQLASAVGAAHDANTAARYRIVHWPGTRTSAPDGNHSDRLGAWSGRCLRDWRIGGDRQDSSRCARRTPARTAVPRRANLLAATRAYAGAAAGKPR